MKATTQKLSSVFILFSTIACLNGVAQTSAFTYQGKLNVNGAPANGRYDFNFRLLDDPTNGTAAPVIPVSLNVPVSNGLFTTAMDFGAQNITGSPQWLEINVTTNGDATFTTLSPRQLLTSAPYAIRSLSASNLLGVLPASQLSGTLLAANFANGIITSNLLATNSVGANQLATNLGVWNRAGTNIFYNTGNVGVGTASPQATLHVLGNQFARAEKIETGDPLGTWLNLANTSTGGGGWSIISSGPSNGEGPGQLLFHNNPNPNTTSGLTRMIINTNGSVGIGTITPQAKLQVTGPVIGGGPSNSIAAGVIASTIAGGGVPGFPNIINGESSFIGAGNLNFIDTGINNSFIGSGYNNINRSVASFIGSGNFNTIAANSSFSIIGGGNANSIQTNSSNSAIVAGNGNQIQSGYNFIGGGNANSIRSNASYSAIGGGDNNSIQSGALYSFIGSGQGNTIQTNAINGVVAGGLQNQILTSSTYDSLGGGWANIASGFASTVPGGAHNSALGDYSFAAGKGAKAQHAGTFVWADNGAADFLSTGEDQFLIRADGGVGIGTATPAAPLHVVGKNQFPQVKISVASNAPYGAFLSLDATPTPGGKEYFIFSSGAFASEGQGKLIFQDYTDGKNILALTSDGYVGIGTTTPGAALDVAGAVRARGGAPGPGGIGNNGFMFSGPGDDDSGMSSSANGQIEFYSDSQEVMRIAEAGAVGIATNNPQAKLHVNGDIKANGKIMMGAAGTNLAIDSTESLRIVRGTISSTGAIVKGSGFTVTHPGTGTYVITFTPAFADVPTITATAVNAIVRAGAVISAGSVNVGTAAFNGSSADDSFHFIAIGTQ